MYPSNHFLPLKQSSWNLSRYLNLEKSQLKNSAGIGDWTQVCNSQSCLWCMYCWLALMQTWNQKLVALEGVKALSLEVPCRESWRRCQTYPTWAPRGPLPSKAYNIYRPSCKDYSTRHGAGPYYLFRHLRT